MVSFFSGLVDDICMNTHPTQAYAPRSARQSRMEMFQKGNTLSFLPSRTPPPRPVSDATEIYDTEFEDDVSDLDSNSGSRSVESVSFSTSKGFFLHF